MRIGSTPKPASSFIFSLIWNLLLLLPPPIAVWGRTSFQLVPLVLHRKACSAYKSATHDRRGLPKPRDLVFMLVVLMWMRMYLAGGVNVAVRMDQTRLFQ